jgi:hypothetical protein
MMRATTAAPPKPPFNGLPTVFAAQCHVARASRAADREAAISAAAVAFGVPAVCIIVQLIGPGT